ncbi:hypothetical protein [Streptomyces sp. NPDC089919]|uniref:hypothetical protein n=1 Tax=Streptomyces sp. NPDC089919 TaxID=3155188 RepID=UPI003439017E
MQHAPIVVHRPSPTGGRRVTLRAGGHEDILGLARSDEDVIEFLRRAEVPDPDEVVLGDSPLIDWIGADPHVYTYDSPEPDLA